MSAVRVALETGAKRAFAIALDWPGWARSGRNEEEALAALTAYAERYAPAVRGASPGPAPTAGGGVHVVERIVGGSGTDFGVPSAPLSGDGDPLDAAELERESAILRAAWSTLDDAARAAEGVELSKGPRGGGRDLPKIVGHVLEAEEAYLVKLGSRRPRTTSTDPGARMNAVRETALAALAARARGEPLADPAQTQKLWSPRYFVRRSAWHALDHAWEIEDRASPSR